MDIQEHPDGVVLKIKVQPRGSKNGINGMFGDAVKVSLTAPPVDGAANAACIEFFASILNIPKNRVKITAGHTGRIKLVKFYGLSRKDLQGRLQGMVTGNG